ncbi:MAG: Peptidylprolyl isomerase [Candidatus Saccharibacteria bacterium]|nr:Peptidylprolyl isomerase [Candidatus Saccharibacteria bacterium]
MKKPTIKAAKQIKRPFKRRKAAEERVNEAFANVPKITNDTVAEHREEILRGARKYIYPLQHSKHRVVRISAVLFASVLILFFAYVGLSLYRFQSTSGFMYDVTRVVPLPVAKTGDKWVSYESYLFELRRNMHYYETQQNTNFDTKDGKTQLTRLKQQAMDSVIQDAYVKQLAKKNKVTVSNREVRDQVELVRSQNRLGSNDRVFRDVLNEFWGWSVSDFERELGQQLLQQKVASKLDSASTARAENVLAQIKGGGDFASLAAQFSEDQATKASGGQYPQPIKRTDHTIVPQVMAELTRLKAGETSGIINTGFTLEIVKAITVTDSTVTAAHIQFNIQDINGAIKPLAAKQPAKHYIKV